MVNQMTAEIQIRKKLDSFRLDVCFQAHTSRVGILGASGCGKSMTLKCIAGIEKPDEGTIRIAENVFYDSKTKQNQKPQQRRIGYLFQNYALFPSMTAAENIAAGLKGPKAEKKRRVQEMIAKFHLDGLAGRLPAELSGGQQQRVALARIMAYQPDVILLDEPFSALDVFLKDQLQRELAQMLEEYTGLVILVSHSRDEIYRFSEELLIIDQGRDLVFGKTADLFADPVYREAAKLTGCKNFSHIQRIDTHTFRASDWGITVHTKKEIPKQASCIGYRAHDFVPVWGRKEENCLPVEISHFAGLPFETNYYIRPQGRQETAETDVVCWFVQRERMRQIEQNGMPDYLKLEEEKVLFLREGKDGG